jgi:exodeoxyribonuclease VII small subunit
MPKQEQSYSKALAELEKIVSQIENNNIDIDKLAETVKKASELLLFCKDKLHKTEVEITRIMKEIEGE